MKGRKRGSTETKKEIKIGVTDKIDLDLRGQEKMSLIVEKHESKSVEEKRRAENEVYCGIWERGILKVS